MALANFRACDFDGRLLVPIIKTFTFVNYAARPVKLPFFATPVTTLTIGKGEGVEFFNDLRHFFTFIVTFMSIHITYKPLNTNTLKTSTDTY